MEDPIGDLAYSMSRWEKTKTDIWSLSASRPLA